MPVPARLAARREFFHIKLELALRLKYIHVPFGQHLQAVGRLKPQRLRGHAEHDRTDLACIILQREIQVPAGGLAAIADFPHHKHPSRQMIRQGILYPGQQGRDGQRLSAAGRVRICWVISSPVSERPM